MYKSTKLSFDYKIFITIWHQQIYKRDIQFYEFSDIYHLSPPPLFIAAKRTSSFAHIPIPPPTPMAMWNLSTKFLIEIYRNQLVEWTNPFHFATPLSSIEINPGKWLCRRRSPPSSMATFVKALCTWFLPYPVAISLRVSPKHVLAPSRHAIFVDISASLDIQWEDEPTLQPTHPQNPQHFRHAHTCIDSVQQQYT